MLSFAEGIEIPRQHGNPLIFRNLNRKTVNKMANEVTAYITRTGSEVEMWKSKPKQKDEIFVASEKMETGSDILDGIFDGFLEDGECVEVSIKKQQNE